MVVGRYDNTVDWNATIFAATLLHTGATNRELMTIFHQGILTSLNNLSLMNKDIETDICLEAEYYGRDLEQGGDGVFGRERRTICR